MKKTLFYFLAVIALLFSVTSADAEAQWITKNSIAAMSNDEILEIHDIIMSELEKRGLSAYSSENGVMVPPGSYTVGVDIPQGTYRLSFPNDNDFTSGLIFLYDESGNMLTFYSVGNIVGVSEIGRIDLLNGMTFELKDMMAMFYEYKGLSF